MGTTTNPQAWSTTAANNASSDAGINWTTGDDPGNVNPAGRGVMTAVKNYVLDVGGKLVAGGSANALTVTTNQGLSAGQLTAGLELAVQAASANTSTTVTFAPDGLTAQPIKRADGSALAVGSIQANMFLNLKYNSGTSEWWAENIAPGAATLPVGMLAPYAGSSAPAGWQLCYGQTISRTTYASLFAAIGTIYGTGDGSTTFGLPDLRGRAAFGADNMGGSAASRLTNSATGGINGSALGNTGGEQAHTTTTNEMPAHVHTIDGTAPGFRTNQSSAQGFTAGGSANAGNAGMDAAGGGAAHNTVPPGIVLNYIIFANA